MSTNRFLSTLARLTWALDFRGKSRLVSSLSLAGTGIFRLPWAEMELDLHDRIQRHMAFGTYERQEARTITSVVGLGATVLDLGAHVGYFTLLMASLVGREGTVIAFEPDPANFERLTANLRLNRFDWVEALNVAASDVDGQAMLFLPDRSGESGWGSLVGASGEKSVSVACRRLDSVLEERRVEELDFVKVDVEGWEPRVLAGLERYLASDAGPTILSELSPARLSSAGSSVDAVSDYLATFGYERVTLRGHAGIIRSNSLFLKSRQNHRSR